MAAQVALDHAFLVVSARSVESIWVSGRLSRDRRASMLQQCALQQSHAFLTFAGFVLCTALVASGLVE